MRVNANLDIIHVNGKELKSLNIISKVILFNKPKNVITDCSYDHNIKVILDFLSEKDQKGFFLLED